MALILLVAVLLLGVAAWPTAACPFCGAQNGLTLVKEVEQASMVLYGTLKNAKNEGDSFSGGTTELHIEAVIKSHEALGDKKMIVINRFVPDDNRYKHLIFFDVYKGKMDPYQGRPLKADSDIAKYLTGAIKLKDKDQATRLRYFFDFLDNADSEIASDAYKEFAYADYKDYSGIAKTLPADKIAEWLQDPKTPSFRFGLYGSMLGHCGKEKHAEVLHKMFEDPNNFPVSGVDGLLAGYVILKPKEGFDFVRSLLKDGERDWATRYAALRTLRFFWEYRPDVITHDQVADAAMLMLDQGDIADLPIEDLRKWERWETAEKVLALKDKETHKAPIVQRALIRYALSCPTKPVATKYLTEMREKNGKMVQETETGLKLESGTK